MHGFTSEQIAVGKYVDIPLSKLVNYSAVRTVDQDHVAQLQECVQRPEDLRSSPIQVYVSENGFAVLDGMHRISAIRANLEASGRGSEDPTVPCLIVATPQGTKEAVIAATAANMRTEVCKSTTFAEKVIAICGLAEGYCVQ